MTEIAIIGSDVQEVIGSAIAISLLTGGWVPLWAGVLITVVDSFLILYIERLGIRHLEAAFAVLISTMAASFFVMYVWAGVPAADVIEGTAPPPPSQCRCAREDIDTAFSLSSPSLSSMSFWAVGPATSLSCRVPCPGRSPAWSLQPPCHSSSPTPSVHPPQLHLGVRTCRQRHPGNGGKWSPS